jgi:hypothetical protein
MFCNADQAGLLNCSGLSALSMPCPETTQADYEAACAACEIWVDVNTRLEHSTLLGALRYDKRRDGSWGRAVQRDLVQFGLVANDRLEPSAGLWDVGEFEKLILPCKVQFWRKTAETLARHRNPLMAAHLGIGLGTFAIDQLHVLNLGVYLQYVTDVFWALIRADAWALGPCYTGEEKQQMCALRLRHELWHWYSRRKHTHPHETLHRLQDLTSEMLGIPSKPKLKLKAAECKTTVYFAVDMLQTFVLSVPDGQILLEAGQCLCHYQETLDANGQVLGPGTIQD